jgi:hypothetical protein
MTRANTPRGPLLVVLLLLAVALILIGLDTFRSTVRVTAQDGSEVVIRLHPRDITEWSGGASAATSRARASTA